MFRPRGRSLTFAIAPFLVYQLQTRLVEQRLLLDVQHHTLADIMINISHHGKSKRSDTAFFNASITPSLMSKTVNRLKRR